MDAKNTTEAWVALRKELSRFGFDYILYGSNRLKGDGVFGKRSDSFFLADIPQEFMEKFWDEELYKTTPIAIWVAQNEGPASLRVGSDLYHADKLPPEQRKTQELLMQRGVTSGYAIGLNPPNTSTATALALINFGMPQEEADKIWEKHGDEIGCYASIFNLKMSTLPVPTSKSVLTKRQQEVLRWVGHGKTSAEVATILGLSTATIEKHLRQAREALGVSTTTQAVLHAQINSMIFTNNRDPS